VSRAVSGANRHQPWHAVLAVAGALLAGSAVAACGIPSGAPEVLSKSGPLFSPIPPTTLPQVGVQVDVYLLDACQVLRPVPRTVGVHSNNLATVLAALVAGPSANEPLTTAIPVGTSVLSADAQDNTATVDLSSAFGLVGGSSRVQAVEQVVWTVETWLKHPEVQVAFEIEGVPVAVPTQVPGTYQATVSVANYPLAPTSAQMGCEQGSS